MIDAWASPATSFAPTMAFGGLDKGYAHEAAKDSGPIVRRRQRNKFAGA